MNGAPRLLRAAAPPHLVLLPGGHAARTVGAEAPRPERAPIAGGSGHLGAAFGVIAAGVIVLGAALGRVLAALR